MTRSSSFFSMIFVIMATYLFAILPVVNSGLIWSVLSTSIVPTTSTSSSSSTSVPPVLLNTSSAKFTVLSQKMVYDGWRKVMKKEIEFPNKKKIVFDVLTNLPAISVFAWDQRTATATLIQEYHPGVERLMYGVIAGGFEQHKHDSLLTCAAYELEEEAHLSARTFIPLLTGDDGSVPFEKYADQFLHPYLALDCTEVSNPKPIDDEEYIVIHPRVTYRQIMDLIAHGKMNTLSAYTSLLAFQKLRELGIPLEMEEGSESEGER